MGKTGRETPESLDADSGLMQRIEVIRLKAGKLMGMGDVSRLVVPKPVLVSPPAQGGNIASRYFTPHACHLAHAATGALALGTACVIEGSVASRYVEPRGFSGGVLNIEHPAGRIEVDLEVSGTGAHREVKRASLVRTARRIFEGSVLVPEALYEWCPHGNHDRPRFPHFDCCGAGARRAGARAELSESRQADPHHRSGLCHPAATTSWHASLRKNGESSRHDRE